MMKFKQRDHKEILLRSFFVLSIFGLILGYSMNKMLIAFNVTKAEANLVSLTINELPQFPVWPSFMCGQGLTNVVAQSIKRGKLGANDVTTDLPVSYIQRSTTKDLSPGDWTGGTGEWPCFVFNTNKTLNFTHGGIDQVILIASSNQIPVNNPTGLLFGIFDAVRTMSTVDPFVGPLPSRNTFTFTKNERYGVNGEYYTYFFVNKQNTVPDNNVVATFAYSPDTYLVTAYREKKPFTEYGVIGSIGGLITYAVAAWVILFGRGKYRSWGLIQRYLLRNSPDATKNDNTNRLFPAFKEKPSDIESQTHLVVTPSPGSDDKSFRPTSAFYFNPNQPNFNPTLSPNSVITSPANSLAGFRLRRYDVDPNKLGTPYDEVDEALIPPTHSWNLDSGISHRDSRNVQNSPPLPPPKNIYPHNFQKNNGSANSLNPEEQRSQYPNVAIGQIPFEKKQKGSGNFQYLSTSGNGTAATGVVTNSYGGNYPSNISSVPMPPSSYLPNVPIQHSNNINIDPSPLPQSQTPFPQGSHISSSSSQGQNQGSLQGPEERW